LRLFSIGGYGLALAALALSNVPLKVKQRESVIWEFFKDHL